MGPNDIDFICHQEIPAQNGHVPNISYDHLLLKALLIQANIDEFCTIGGHGGAVDGL